MLGDEPDAPQKGVAAGRPETVLAVERLRAPGRFAEFSLAARAGTVYAIAGQLGSGASDVVRGIGGLIPDLAGTVLVNGRRVRPGHPVPATRAGIAFVSNDRKTEGLFLDRPVGTNLLATRLPSLTRRGWVNGRRWHAAERHLAGISGIDEGRIAARVGALSGGNQQKVFVGRTLERPDVTVLLLDDPTRGVDVGGRAAIHQLVRHAAGQGMTVLFCSTELDELVELADVVITMHKGAVVGRHEGHVSGDRLLHEMTHGEPAPAVPAGGTG
jgi:ribose transport system ATP-binding protein/rhamnose transport system ATP-binding protein